MYKDMIHIITLLEQILILVYNKIKNIIVVD